MMNKPRKTSRIRRTPRAPGAEQTPLPEFHLRGRLWLDAGGRPGLTEPGADLLEQISAHGSLSEAARRLRYSYRRAWMLLDAMNHAWGQPVVLTATGGKHGGGAHLTEFGHTLLAGYRHLQVEFENFLDQHHAAIALALRPHGNP